MKIISILFIAILACAATNISTSAEEESVSKIERLHGLTEKEISEEFGEPFSQEQYKIKDGITEFQVELLNTYPLTNPDNLEVEIKELWWKDGDYFITVWLHFIEDDWIVLNTCRWHKTVEF